jgi:hypothetical protein
VYTDDSSRIDRVVLVRAGSSTHNFNPDQRLIECAFEVASPTRLEVQAPPNNAVAPPGTYLIFVLTDDRIPSEGEFIKVCQGTSSPPRPDWPDWLDDWVLELIRWRLRQVPPRPWPPPWPGGSLIPELPKAPQRRPPQEDDLRRWLETIRGRAEDTLETLLGLGRDLEQRYRHLFDDEADKRSD